MISDPIWNVHCALVRFLDAGQDALEEKFVTEDDDIDSPGARLGMLQSVNAAKELLAHLEQTFEFTNGMATEKEGTCLD
jgi:hypothetical protein